MSGTKARLVRNAVFNSVSWASNIVVNLITIPLIVRYLGVEAFGIYVLLTGLFGYFALLDLGSGQGLVKYVAEFDGRRDRRSVSHYINAAILLQVILGFAGTGVLCWFNHDIIALLNVGSGFVQEARISLYISSVGFFLTMVLGNFSSALQGLQRFDAIGKINVAFSILAATVTIVVLVMGGGLRDVIIVSVCSSASSAIAFAVALKRSFPEYRFSVLVSPHVIQQLFTYSGYLFISRTSHVLNNYFLRFVVSVFWGPAAVAFFVVPMKLVLAIQGALGSVAGVLFPFASEAMASGRQEELHRVYVKASRYIACFSIPLYLFLIFFSRDILMLWMGPEFAEQTWIVLILVAAAWLVSSFTIVPTNAVLGIGHSRTVAWFSLAVAALNVIFSLWFTRLWSAQGAAGGIALTQVLAFPFVWYATVKLLLFDWRLYVNQVISANYKAILVFLLVGGASMALGTTAGATPHLLFALGLGLVVLYLSMVQRAGAISISDVRMLFARQT